MEEILNYQGKVLIRQDSFANEIVRYANGYFHMNNGELFVELLEKSPFKNFQFSKSRFIAQVEIQEPNLFRIFDLNLEPTEMKFFEQEILQFKVEINNDFKTFKSYLEKKQLEYELNINKEKHKVKKI
jgi:hypothetical protein